MDNSALNPRRPKGKRQSASRRIAELERRANDIAQIVGAQAGLIEDLKKRIDDLEYFQSNAREILQIAEVQDT
jgi:hypothetical protein